MSLLKLKNIFALSRKYMTSFWKDIKKDYDTSLPLALMVDKCLGEKDICDMWQAHYNLLNSVACSKSKELVEQKLHSIKDSASVFRPVDIFNAQKCTKTGKAYGVDGLVTAFMLVQLYMYI